MKVFISLTVVCLFAGVWALELSEEHKAKGRSLLEECVKQEKVSEEDADRLRKKDVANPSASMKCFSACFFEKLSILKDNKVQADVAQQKVAAVIGDAKAVEVVSKCKDVKGADRCETGYEIFKCGASLKAQILA